MEYTVSATDLANLRLNETDEVKEVLRNVAVILATPKGSVPMYRDFGLDMSFLDKPANVAKNMAVIPVREAIECQRRSDFVVFRRTGNVEKWRVNVYRL